MTSCCCRVRLIISIIRFKKSLVCLAHLRAFLLSNKSCDTAITFVDADSVEIGSLLETLQKQLLFRNVLAVAYFSHFPIMAAATSSQPFSAPSPAMFVATATEKFFSGASHMTRYHMVFEPLCVSAFPP